MGDDEEDNSHLCGRLGESREKCHTCCFKEANTTFLKSGLHLVKMTKRRFASSNRFSHLLGSSSNEQPN